MFKSKKEANDAKVSSDLAIANSIAKAQKEKAIVLAEADRESREAQINADTLIAQKENELEIRKAELQKDADTKKSYCRCILSDSARNGTKEY